VNVNAQDELGMTPLMYVLDNRDSQLQKLLLKHPKIDTRLRNKVTSTKTHTKVDINASLTHIFFYCRKVAARWNSLAILCFASS